MNFSSKEADAQASQDFQNMQRATLLRLPLDQREAGRQALLDKLPRGTILTNLFDQLKARNKSDTFDVAPRNACLAELQQEISAWSRTNFGSQVSKQNGVVLGPLAPLLGIAEELCEYADAYSHPMSFESIPEYEIETLDALADLMIYLLDYASRSGFAVSITVDELHETMYQKIVDANLVQNGFDPVLPENPVLAIAMKLQRLLHLNLKAHQGIRGLSDPLVFASRNRDAVIDIYLTIERITGFSFLPTVTSVWSKVKQRNWNKNPTNAHVVAAEADVLLD